MNFQNPMIDNDDPRLTAYAMGELAPADVAQIEAALKLSPELRAVVADIRQASESISNVFLSEPLLQLTPEQKSQLLNAAESASNFDVQSANGQSNSGAQSANQTAANVLPTVASEYDRPFSASSVHWLKLAIAAGLASVLIGGAYYFSRADRRPIAAADRATSDRDLADEPQLRLEDEEALEQESNAPLTLPPTEPPTENYQSEALKESPDFDAASPIQRPAMVRSANDRTMRSRRSSRKAGEADAAADLKTDSLIEMPRPNRAAADGSEVAKKLNKNPIFMERTKSSAENSPVDAFKYEADLNSNGLAMAQELIDQSALGSLNLIVVAQSSDSRYLYGAGTGDGDRTRSLASSQDQLSPPIKSKGASESPDAGNATPVLPATFTLQISDQDAKQMVELLANNVDPLQKRKLSFDDLIGLQSVQRLAKRADVDDIQREKIDGGFEAAPTSSNNDALLSEADEPASPTSPRQAAAATLATKLREFVDQPAIARNSRLPLVAPGAAAMQAQPAIASETQAAPNNATLEQGEYSSSSKDGLLQVPQADQDFKLLKNQQPLSEFDFDYSQIIQQLTLNLEIRNQSLPNSR